jgi:hypothetical protein
MVFQARGWRIEGREVEIGGEQSVVDNGREWRVRVRLGD